MHVFADSSNEVYAVACVECFVSENSNVSIIYLYGKCIKCMVCPVSGALTIPHLEHVAAALATHVATAMLQESSINYDHVVYWSDSLII